MCGVVRICVALNKNNEIITVNDHKGKHELYFEKMLHHVLFQRRSFYICSHYIPAQGWIFTLEKLGQALSHSVTIKTETPVRWNTKQQLCNKHLKTLSFGLDCYVSCFCIDSILWYSLRLCCCCIGLYCTSLDEYTSIKVTSLNSKQNKCLLQDYNVQGLYV